MPEMKTAGSGVHQCGKYVIDVPYIDQSVKFPTGCESVSAVMLLKFWGIDITVEQFIEEYLDKKKFAQRGEDLYGPDPREYFCGSPYDENSMGCYAPVIAKTLRKILGSRYQVTDETGCTLSQLTENYVRKGIPVLVWSCINMREPIVGPEWKLYDSGEIFTWISNEHCMVLVGYDEKGYYFNDPYENNGLVCHSKELAEARHRAQHMQAVAVLCQSEDEHRKQMGNDLHGSNER